MKAFGFVIGSEHGDTVFHGLTQGSQRIVFLQACQYVVFFLTQFLNMFMHPVKAVLIWLWDSDQLTDVDNLIVRERCHGLDKFDIQDAVFKALIGMTAYTKDITDMFVKFFAVVRVFCNGHGFFGNLIGFDK